ncbi:excinuclease ABC subunit UvrA [Chondromyces apiculatus]|uniref:UvrABC system protein A n=1 Tax=Chondromyces apiculatus DSM 436 TaxID=1192034 RepID=A0A017TG74_9BACT|nr:excinuclease ABC subunit UvrA [Chondromyces apiculatus]EYF07922.1 Excinuclease ABC subunit A [Chondromyces apiculatus DSM 436]
MDRLIVRGARQHNLKNVSVSIPRDKLVVITGPSGSGKSSLAFDTIYAEGQRRYVESLSAYARQFLEQLSKPDVDSIEGLSPAIAIEQRALAKSPRSTVGTVTEISDYMRLLFARVGTPHCPACGKRIEAQTVQQIVDRILGLDEGARATILAPIARARKGELKLDIERLRREGFVRARIDGEIVDLGDELVLDRSRPHDLDVVIDRIVIKEGIKGRLTDSVELALKLGDGRLLVDISSEGVKVEPLWMSERFACIDCGISLPPIEPRMFSFNGPHGACPACDGIGARTRIDPDRVVPDARRTLREGAVVAWGRRGSLRLSTETERAVTALGADPDVAWSKLPAATREAILHGSEAQTGRGKKRGAYEGIISRLEKLLANGEAQVGGSEDDDDGFDDDAGSLGDELGRFVVTRVCDACEGRRLRPEALAVQLGSRNIADVGTLALRNLRTFLEDLVPEGSASGGEAVLMPRERAIAEPLLRAVIARLGFLIDVGLDYLTLDRSAQTLSGGEGQRIRLATQIGAALVGVLYVLDEPSVGLHARDNTRLLEALRRLCDLGNTIIVVEHDRDAILAADHVIDMGPGAGVHGGTVISQGTPAEISADPTSITGPYLSGKKQLPIPTKRQRPDGRFIRVSGARAHNLRNVTAEIPIGLFCTVTGVSGSGKSSLIVDTLLPAAKNELYRSSAPVGACDGIEGLTHIDKVISIDQAPIGRTPRSNPATYTGVFSLLRELYAGLPESRTRGYKAGRFSFNVKGGRCEACQGDGVLRIEMHFLPDIFVTCETCGGRRYNRETLEVLYRGMSIADALALTVEQAIEQLDAIPRIRERLVALSRVGLGYITLGQPATTLSGGEAQRVKLARELARKATGRTLYVLDEPTTGLHFSDIEVLTASLTSLRDAGNTVLVIEHNLDVIACSDWVIDLGPEGGERGGTIVATGTPEDVAQTDASHTGQYLREVLGRRKKSAAPGAKGRPAAKAK